MFVWFLVNLPWGVESKRVSCLEQASAAIAPVFEPLGSGTWEAASSLITGSSPRRSWPSPWAGFNFQSSARVPGKSTVTLGLALMLLQTVAGAVRAWPVACAWGR